MGASTCKCVCSTAAAAAAAVTMGLQEVLRYTGLHNVIQTGAVGPTCIRKHTCKVLKKIAFGFCIDKIEP